jgi:Na+/proline symporter
MGALDRLRAVLLGRGPWVRILGLGALFSGVALLVNILWNISLPVALATSAALLALSAAAVWRRAMPDDRRWLVRRVALGIGVGLVATLSYDTSKAILSALDPSPYNPFDLIRIFGRLLLGPNTPDPLASIAGGAFHLLNGTSFAIAFTLLVRRRYVLLGVLWGLFLEIFQLTLYPGWLNIKFYNEFVQISSLSHVVYGLVLGTLVRYAEPRFGPGNRSASTERGAT